MNDYSFHYRILAPMQIYCNNIACSDRNQSYGSVTAVQQSKTLQGLTIVSRRSSFPFDSILKLASPDNTQDLHHDFGGLRDYDITNQYDLTLGSYRFHILG